MGKLKIGIIGCGAIAREKHVDALLQFPDRCEIVALADAQPAAANSLQRERLPGAAVYEGYEALLEDPAVDAVHICTPNHSHCEIAVKALEAGKHVMCEKPMAETYADACRMIKTAEKNNGNSLSAIKTVSEAIHRRSMPLFSRGIWVKSILQKRTPHAGKRCRHGAAFFH